MRLEGSRCKARSEDGAWGFRALFWKLTFTVTFVTAYTWGRVFDIVNLNLILSYMYLLACLLVLVIDDA